MHSGAGLGFVLHSPPPLSSGGSGGGSGVNVEREELVHTTAFLAGDITITLTNTPISSDAILLFYNGAKVRPGLGGFSVSSNIITIEFSDDPATYDNGEVLFELYSLWA